MQFDHGDTIRSEVVGGPVTAGHRVTEHDEDLGRVGSEHGE